MTQMTFLQLVQKDFIENRSRALDLAAFLDRVDRASEGNEIDFRIETLKQALCELLKGGPDRVLRVQNILSDQSIFLRESAEKNQGAFGAAPTQCC